MKIYRSILLNEGEEINKDNLGCSWTLCEIFAEDHAKDINGDLKKDGFVVLQADVNEDEIDWSNTLNAMENRGHEFEVVIRGNIKATVLIVEGIDFDEDAVIEGNGGDNTFEDYYDNYDGELTKEDLLLLSLEF
jgi:hypothetical protein